LTHPDATTTATMAGLLVDYAASDEEEEQRQPEQPAKKHAREGSAEDEERATKREKVELPPLPGDLFGAPPAPPPPSPPQPQLQQQQPSPTPPKPRTKSLMTPPQVWKRQANIVTADDV